MGASENTAYDVVVIGGGPAGCSTAVFTAWYGPDTLVLDRGNLLSSSVRPSRTA
ncbi:FAD-dependent oxidoreductase [Haloarcula sp. H-GB4]|uniref:FAD-dependent oxidoreductase n=1 Tax=Haloarcula sp. H-GB4 TaxID=3069755 RepID=UPI0027AF7B22|nr:FAD-dependent oxidoreductase [Haloarcula sp. H-GB4]MDQ2074462.1 FAD-dependent oxidoreductase [Haloarcula sp. H-GB4]